jgi:hypothetical protein
MNPQIIYVRASEDWYVGVFAKYLFGQWHFVYWTHESENSDATFIDTVPKDHEAEMSKLQEMPEYGVYEEYTYDGNPTF